MLPLITQHGNGFQIGSFLWDPNDRNPLSVVKVVRVIFDSSIYTFLREDSSVSRDVELLCERLKATSLDKSSVIIKFLETALKLRTWVNEFITNKQKSLASSFAIDLLRCIRDKRSMHYHKKIDNRELPWELLDKNQCLSIDSSQGEVVTIPAQTSSLSISNLSSLQSVLVKQIEGIVHLDLSHLSLMKVPESLILLISLQHLNLSYNRISVFQGQLPPSLEFLELQQNPLNELLSDINVPTVRFGSFTKWPAGLSHLHPVETLSVAGWGPDVIDDQFEALTTLRELDLIGLKPTSLTALQKVPSLRTLTVVGLDATDLFSLTQLTDLHIISGSFRNYIRSFNEEGEPSLCPLHPFASIGQLTNLQVLSLEDCLNSIIPESILACTQINLLCRMLLRNNHPAQKTLFDSWLKGPLPKQAPFPKDPLDLKKYSKRLQLPSSRYYLMPSTRRRVINALVSHHTTVHIYETEICRDFAGHYRSRVFILIPTNLYHEYFATYLLAMTESVQVGYNFQKDTLKKLLPFLIKKCPMLAQDRLEDPREFDEAFQEGKIWFEEIKGTAGIDVKTAWRPKGEDGYLVPPNKRSRLDDLYKNAFS